MKIYNTSKGIVVKRSEHWFLFDRINWNDLVFAEDIEDLIEAKIKSNKLTESSAGKIMDTGLLPPIGIQEIWAAGVTYFRSREARMEESKKYGGDNFYDRVYDADRPEIFFKANPYRVVGHNQKIRIRKDSSWNVPEPELTVLVSPNRKIQGFTVGNDVSSRSIEGENPLYLPQAKCYDKSTAIGPGLLVKRYLPNETKIAMTINRDGKEIFNGSTSLENMKRNIEELIEYLFRECSFPKGVYLMTGTGIIPGNDFSLKKDDIVQIEIDSVGKLINQVE